MNKAKRKTTEIPIRIYRPKFSAMLLEMIFLPFLCSATWGILPSMINLSIKINNRYSSLVSGDYTQYYLIILTLIPFFVYLAYRSHYLAIYENGIMLSGPLKKVFSSWDNLKSLEVAKSVKGKPLYYYLLTNEDVDERVKMGQNQISLQKYARISLLTITEADYKRLVPEGQLGTDLLHFAPHLFE